MAKLTFGQKQTAGEKEASVKKRYGGTTGASKGSKPAPKAKVSVKGTNPLKGKYSATWKKEF